MIQNFMSNPINIAENISQIQQKIADYAQKYPNAAENILLLAVSKTKPAATLEQAYQAGLHDFGESYLQEALEKIQILSTLDICWHFIGPIQSNKTRDIATHFQWVHSVSRLKIARRLNDQRNPELPPLNICLQVNISNEAGKSGTSLKELPKLVKDVSQLTNIRLRGLMAIPAKTDGFEQQRKAFSQLHQAMIELNTTGLNMDTLSIGMSKDMESAIAEGSTILRIGTAIFGKRDN
jgi:PLP dependent protein